MFVGWLVFDCLFVSIFFFYIIVYYTHTLYVCNLKLPCKSSAPVHLTFDCLVIIFQIVSPLIERTISYFMEIIWNIMSMHSSSYQNNLLLLQKNDTLHVI